MKAIVERPRAKRQFLARRNLIEGDPLHRDGSIVSSRAVANRRVFRRISTACRLL